MFTVKLYISCWRALGAEEINLHIHDGILAVLGLLGMSCCSSTAEHQRHVHDIPTLPHPHQQAQCAARPCDHLVAPPSYAGELVALRGHTEAIASVTA
jgi:hypothetical protein